MAVKTYDSGSIRLLTGLDTVRQHPSLYIGSTDDFGLFLILRELLDNVVDEFSAGRATFLRTSITAKDYWVLDDGTGVPQGVKSLTVEVDGKAVSSKLPTMQAIFGNLHTSGKHSGAYETARGVHGVGAKGTNALSTSFKVWTFYESSWYYIEFAKGKLVSKGVESKRPPKDSPFGLVKTGTLIQFVPDFSIFTAKTFAQSMLDEWAELTAYLNPTFKIHIDWKGKSKEYYSKLGPREYLDKRIQLLKAIPLSERVAFEATSALCDIAVSFTDFDGQDLRGATNGLTNSQGGSHVNSVQNGLFRAVKEQAKKKQVFTALDFRDGLVGIVNAKLSGAKFSSQAKVQLTDERMADPFEEWVFVQAKAFFTKNKGLAEKICQRAANLNQLKNTFRASKAALKEIAKASKQMPAKYAPADPSTKPADRELFLVEGDSAGGCHLGETKIRLLNGESKRLDVMAEEYKQGIDHYGYAYDLKAKETVVIKFDEPRVTKYTTELVEVTLSNGETVTCTPDHPWLTRLGEYVATEDLAEGTALMPHTEAIPHHSQSVDGIITLASVKRITLVEPVPVYDATVPKYHNYALDAGVYVHNTTKLARYPWQAVLPLKGKILNAMRAKGSTALESESVAHILAAIGFDAKVSDPYVKLKVGKIICLADPDPDGPFVAGTEIGVKYHANDEHEVLSPIENLVGAEFLVRTWNGHKVIYTKASCKLVKHVTQVVTMNIGNVKYKVDPDHKWAILNYKAWEISEGTVIYDAAHGIAWKRARDIRSGDRIFTPPEGKFKGGNQEYQLVSKARTQELKEPVPVYCLAVKGYGNFLTPAGHVSSNCHINTLLLTLFYTFLPRLFEMGMVYVVDAPEFYATHKAAMVTGDSLSDVQSKLAVLGAAASTPVKHIKGWGEVNANQLRPLAMNADTRRLIRVTAPATSEDHDNFTKLMSEDVEFRRNLLGV